MGRLAGRGPGLWGSARTKILAVPRRPFRGRTLATAAARQVPFQVLRILNLQNPENLNSSRNATRDRTGVHSSRSGRPEVRSVEPQMCATTLVFAMHGRSGRPEIRSGEPEMCAKTLVFALTAT